MIKIVADSDIPYIKGVLDPFARVAYVKGAEISRRDVAGADALIVRTRTRCDRELLDGSSVRLVATATAGYDHIDMDYCREAGIEVAVAAGSNARGVLQWVAAALACLSGRKGWAPEQKTIGVVGVGNVGSLVARYAEHWGFEVLCCDPPLQRSGARAPAGDGFHTIDHIASRCDIVTFHVPLSRDGEDATFHMGDEEFLRRLAPGSTVINASRGEVVDTRALSDFIDGGRGGAILDTWENEPAIDRRLLALSMLGTPHIAGYTRQGKANASAAAVRAVAKRLGLPPVDWYPGEVAAAEPKMIGWEEMKASIADYCDIEDESRGLKSDPDGFERMRNGYSYREEYF